jgi:hypothetical protein
MAGKQAGGSRVQQGASTYYIDGQATTGSYADVTFKRGDGVEVSALSMQAHISLMVEAKASGQDVKIKILQRAHSDAEWRELQAETDVTTASVAEVYADNVRAGEIKIQVKEGSTSGGTVMIAVCAK